MTETVEAATRETGPFGWPVADRGLATLRSESSVTTTWGRNEDLAALQIRPRLAVAPDLLLRQLDPEALGTDAVRINDRLRPLYEAITAGAAALALGESAPEPYVRAPHPGS